MEGDYAKPIDLPTLEQRHSARAAATEAGRSSSTPRRHAMSSIDVGYNDLREKLAERVQGRVCHAVQEGCLGVFVPIEGWQEQLDDTAKKLGLPVSDVRLQAMYIVADINRIDGYRADLRNMSRWQVVDEFGNGFLGESETGIYVAWDC